MLAGEHSHHHGVFIWVTRSLDLWGSESNVYTRCLGLCVVIVLVNCAMVWVNFTVVSLRLLMSSSKILFLYTFVLLVA